MKKYLLLIVISLVACQKKVVHEKETNRRSIDSVFAEMLNNNDSVRLQTFANDIERFQISESEKKALRDCIKLNNHKEKFNNAGIDSLSWNHINLLYKNNFKKVGLFYSRYKFDSELVNRTLPNYLSKIDSTLVIFSDIKTNCNYAQLYQLKITHLMAKSYYSLALKEMQKLIKTTEIIENCPDIQFSVYMEMSFMYADLKLFDKSLESAFKALSYAEVPSDKAISYSLIAKAYLELKTPKKGIEYLKKALNTEAKDNFHMHNYYKAILFEMYVELNQFKKAEALFKEYESSQGFLKYHEYLFCRAKAIQLKKQKNYPEAINYFLRAKSFISEEKLITRRIILKDLSDVYVLNKNLDQALFYLNEYQKKEELYTEQQNKNLINEQTVALNVARKEAELQKTKKITIEQELSISRKNKTIIVGVLITISLVLLTVVILYFNRLYKKKNIELQLQKLKVENSNQELNSALFEKSLLMREIHHRVKNNLQLVMSLLNIQATDKENTSIEGFIEKGQSRIASMILIHENLYQKEDVSNIDFETYTVSLVQNIRNTFGDISDRITVIVNVKNVFFDIQTSIPIGLIINELVTNSFKHGFPDGRTGQITILIKQISESNYKLVIQDTGIGFTNEKLENKSIGLELVTILVLQLKGKLNINSKNGFTFEMIFDIK
jgi:two-component sensor histidine kinase